MHLDINHTEQVERLSLAGVIFQPPVLTVYLRAKDSLGEVEKGTVVAEGYKRCGACGHAKKFYLFNKNSGSKTNTSGSCKECQKSTAAKSYGKTKKSRNYKKYYQEHKEAKQEQARKYYRENKETLTAKHKAYLATKAGKKVMTKAHGKRRAALAVNKGIPYTRQMVIDRDGAFLEREHPLCYLCLEDITDTSGKGLHLDHVVPVVMGGLDCFSNIACSHATCNLTREKDARELTPEQVTDIIQIAEEYIDAHPDLFAD